jgi:polar amino acid transport system ATP-binding protein
VIGQDRLLRVEQVHKWFGDLHVLRGITVDVRPGEVIVLIGPSGSGKSTLLRTMNMLEEPTLGKVWFDGQDLTDVRSDLNRVRTRMGMVFQHFNLFPHMTALANVTLALDIVLGLDNDAARERALVQLDAVGLGDKADSYPAQLSGGQQQRVAIARALAGQPALILADEPTGALDTHTGQEILALFNDLNREGATIVLVTHDHEVAAATKRTIEMRDGHIVRDQVNNVRAA